MAELITEMFRDRAAAERAVADLQQLGYTQDDISVMMNDQTRARDFATDTGAKAAEGAGVGIGGTLGAIIAAVTPTDNVVTAPDRVVRVAGGAAAPLIVGPLAAALAGAGAGVGAGGLGGGLIGVLVGAGIPHDQAVQYESDLNAGGILVGVHVSSADAARVQRVLRSEGARARINAVVRAAQDTVGRGLHDTVGRAVGDDLAEGSAGGAVGSSKDWGEPLAARFPGDPGEDAPPPDDETETQTERRFLTQ